MITVMMIMVMVVVMMMTTTTTTTTTTTATMRAAARMCPAWYHLTRIAPLARARRSLNEFDVRARSCPRSLV